MPRDVFSPRTIGPELLATDERIQKAAIRGLRMAARLGRGAVVKEIRGNKPFPLVDLGELARSPKVTEMSNGALLEVTAPQGVYQEYGTGPAAGNAPFTPPFEVIKKWALRKARRSSSRRGGKGSPKKQKKQTRDPVQESLDAAASLTRQSRKHLAAARDLLRTPQQRQKLKAKRRAAKEKREAAAKAEALKMAGAVWANKREKGMKGKHYYERASQQFQGHVDKMVERQVARVSR